VLEVDIDVDVDVVVVAEITTSTLLEQLLIINPSEIEIITKRIIVRIKRLNRSLLIFHHPIMRLVGNSETGE
jgi:hypothetical protein